jgi:hypothetical protein
MLGADLLAFLGRLRGAHPVAVFGALLRRHQLRAVNRRAVVHRRHAPRRLREHASGKQRGRDCGDQGLAFHLNLRRPIGRSDFPANRRGGGRDPLSI